MKQWDFVRYLGIVWRITRIANGYAYIVNEDKMRRVDSRLLEPIGCEVEDDPYPYE